MYSSSDIFNITEINNIIMDYKSDLEGFETHKNIMKRVCNDIDSIGFVYGLNCWFYSFPKIIFLNQEFNGLNRFIRGIRTMHIVMYSSEILDELKLKEYHCEWHKCV